MAQVGHCDFGCGNEISRGPFAIVPKSEQAFLQVCLGSHHFMFYPTDVRERTAKTLRMGKPLFIQTQSLLAISSYSMMVASSGGSVAYGVMCT